MRVTSIAFALLLLAGCASAPPPPAAPVVAYEQKLAWILQLEDRRMLAFELPPPPPPVVVPGRRAPAPPPPPASKPDLAVLVADGDARVRRRAAIATGRVGLADGAAILVPLVTDPDPDVRQMAAFGLGLLGVALEGNPGTLHPSLQLAVAPLTGALADAMPLVRGRAAEALGQIGAREAAGAIGKMAGEYARLPAVAAMEPDDERWPASPEADALRLALFALVRLRAFDAIAAAVLDASGRPVSRWWPVAFALQRVNDPRAAPALRDLLPTPGRYTASFAIRGLGSAKDASAIKPIVALLDPSRQPLEVVVSAIRAAAALDAAEAAVPLVRLAGNTLVDPNIRLEAITALGGMRAADALAPIQDLLLESWPALRAAALRASAAIDPDGFVLLLSGLDPDPNWTVRAALADVLGTLPADLALPRLRAMLDDEDKRVLPRVLAGLVRLRAPGVEAVVLEKLKDPDLAVREAAARHVGELKIAGAQDALRDAYKAGLADAGYGARSAALAALAGHGAAAADTLKAALADRDWPVRVRAAQLLDAIEPAGAHLQAIRPAPGNPPAPYDDPLLLSPPNSPHVFIETAKGTIEIELAVLDAPQTSRNFMTLARKGFFNGLAIHRVVPNFVVQDGDPRGDGGGGPGYSIRDELNERPFLRGTVGMALSWRDTGGSQFFIAHSPQPHLDGRYTVFGHVVKGMDVVDRIQVGDVIQQVRIWDGKTMQDP